MGDGLVDEGVGVRHCVVILGAELRSSQRDGLVGEPQAAMEGISTLLRSLRKSRSDSFQALIKTAFGSRRSRSSGAPVPGISCELSLTSHGSGLQPHSLQERFIPQIAAQRRKFAMRLQVL